MSKILQCLTTSLLLIGPCITTLAQQSGSLLWKISGNDMTHPSYLFGTIHMLPEDKYFFTDKMKEAFDKSDRLTLEAELDVPLAEQMKMASQMIMPEGKTWADYMTEEEYAQVRSAFVDSLGIKTKKIDKYAKIKPVYVSGLIMPELLGKVKIYEQELSQMARKQKKDISGLETLQEQMDIVSSIPIEDQIEDLRTSTASMMRDYYELLDAYLKQDLVALEKNVLDTESFDKMEAKLLTERNDRWIEAMVKELGNETVFFAVGAMHLVGDDGLIQKLRARGYTVEPVR